MTWKVEIASDGAKALIVAGSHPIDLLVTDILMPEADGIETIIAFRQQYPSVKIVAMSGGGDYLDKTPLEWALRLGADVALEKPFEFTILRDTIRRLLEPERACCCLNSTNS